ncbi:UNVERIFIED_CONTAM: hypothetical protein FKN15_063669 [Acipenser sinensis]
MGQTANFVRSSQNALESQACRSRGRSLILAQSSSASQWEPASSTLKSETPRSPPSSSYSPPSGAKRRKHHSHSPDQINKIWDTVLSQQGILTELIQGRLALPSQAQSVPPLQVPLCPTTRGAGRLRGRSLHCYLRRSAPSQVLYRPYSPSSQQLDELHLVSRTLLLLSKLSGQVAGRNLVTLVAAQRQLWLSQARVSEGDKTTLLDAPVTHGHTFGPAVDDMLQCSHCARGSTMELDRHPTCHLERRSLAIPPVFSLSVHPYSAVMRRTLDNQQGVKQITLEEALNREDIQAAIICTENESHEEYIRKFLDAGKHVCVEYPMSLSVAVARELWELADKKGKILHEEHIEILTADYKQLKKEVSGKEILEGTLHFTGTVSYNGRWKKWPFQSVRGLMLQEENVELETAMIEAPVFVESKPLTWIEERAPGLGRVKNINFRFDSGTLDHIPNAPKEPVGIFMQDLNWFGEKLLGQVLSEQLQAERRRILHCLELADRIKELCQKSAQNNL